MGATPELSADEPIEFNAETQVLTARGNAVFVDRDVTVRADRIDFFRRENRIVAEGGVRVDQPGFRLITSRLEYAVDTRAFSSGPFRAGVPPLFVEGLSFEGTREEIDFSEVRLHFQEPDPYSPGAQARALRVRPDEGFAVSGLRLGLTRGWTVPAPSMQRSFEVPRAAVRGDVGFRNNLGVYARSRVLLPAGEALSLGANLDVYSARGVLAGPAIRFEERSDAGNRRFIEASSGLIRDGSRRFRGVDLLGAPVPRDRWFVEGIWREDHGPWQLAGAATLMRDSEMMRDFRPDAYDFAQQPDVFLEGRYVADNWEVGLFTRINPNNFHPMVERYPELRLDVLPQPVGASGFVHSAGVALVNYRQSFLDPLAVGNPLLPFFALPDPPPGGWELLDAPSVFRATVFYRLEHPLELTPWLSFRPLAGFRQTYYDEGVGARAGRSADYWRGEVGFDLVGHAFATWDVSSRAWRIDGLRHILRPVVRYRWQPTGGDPTADLPGYEIDAFSPVLPVLDLPFARNLDNADERHVIRLGLENLLHTQRDGGVAELLRLNLYQDINLAAPPGAPAWEAFYVQAGLRPARWIEVQLAQRFRTEAVALNETRLRVSLRSAERWTLDFTADYLEGFISQYGLAGFYRVNPRLGLFAQARYDDRLSTVTRHGYGVRQRIGRAWEIDYGLVFNRGTTREDDIQVSLAVRFFAF